MSSPTAWPSLSFTALNPSRSMSTRVKAQPYRALWTEALRRAASKDRRLAMLVSGSWSALCRARWSVRASWHTLRTTSRTTWGTQSGSQNTPGDVASAAGESPSRLFCPSRKACVPSASSRSTTTASVSW